MPVKPLSTEPHTQDLHLDLSPEEEAELDRRVAMIDDPNVPKIPLGDFLEKLDVLRAESLRKMRAESR